MTTFILIILLITSGFQYFLSSVLKMEVPLAAPSKSVVLAKGPEEKKKVAVDLPQEKDDPLLTPASTSAPSPSSQEIPAPLKTASPAATSAAVASETSVKEMEIKILELINAERRRNNLPPLKNSAVLSAIARAHSADMQEKSYFNHSSPEGCSASCRLKNTEYLYKTFGENIYTLYGYRLDATQTASKIVEGWMGSKGHRANILGKAYTEGGVGISLVGTKIYATSLFALPM